MKLLTKISALLMCVTFLGFSQIDDLDFKTMVTLDGKSFSIHDFVEQGRHIYLQMMFNG